MSDPDEITILRFHPRETETVVPDIPVVLPKLRVVAESRDLFPEALMEPDSTVRRLPQVL